MTKRTVFQNRMPMYLGGLLLGLAAMVAIFQAKRAMMPKFHEISDDRPDIALAPGSSIKFIYSEEPGYFLIPGMPTRAIVSRRADDGKLAPIFSAKYGALTEREPVLGPFTEEGRYQLDADFYICAEAGVAYCTKYVVQQELEVERNASNGENRIELDLQKLADEGLKAGKLSEPTSQEEE